MSDGLGLAFFGLHVRFCEFPAPGATARSVWPWVAHGSLRIWNAYAAWYDVEPERGRWDFRRLDALVQKAASRGVAPLIVLGRTPTWASARPDEPCGEVPGCGAEPANLDDWNVYVAAVARRYRDVVHAYEVWNEPAFSDFEPVLDDTGRARQYFTGTAKMMAKLAKRARNVLDDVDPAALLVAPSVTCEGNGVGRLQAFLAAGGAGVVDAIGYHLYQPYPEDAVHELARLHDMLAANGAGGLPVWNTEQGYILDEADATPLDDVPHRDTWGVPLSPRNAGILLARAHILQAFHGVSRIYWYTWDHDLAPDPMGLAPQGGPLNETGLAWTRVQKWLLGAVPVEAERAESGLWRCVFTRAGEPFVIVWREAGTEDIDVLGSNTREALYGLPAPLAADTLAVGQEPVLIGP